MTEENHTGIEKVPGSGRKEKTQRSPKRQSPALNWDFESYFASEPSVGHPGRIRASSWDDSDDNLPPVPDASGSKTCRIYTRDDQKPKSASVVSEINELKKQFFKTREAEGKSSLETVNDEPEADLTIDRRLSPARIRRRSRSSGSSSPVMEMETQVSPKEINKSSGSDSELQELSPKALQYDPTFYLNNFFTELRSRRISLVDPISVIESIEKEIPKYDSDGYNEISALDGKDMNSYFMKTSRKLSQILEVEETSRKEPENKSEENLPRGLFEKCSEKPTEKDASPLPTARSKKSEKKAEEGGKQKEKYKSFSVEHLRIIKKSENDAQGSLSERSPRFFEGKLDDSFIRLLPKTGKTRLGSPKCLGDRGTNTPLQLFCVNTPNGDDKSILERLEDERKALQSLKLELRKNIGTATPTKSTDRSEKSHRTSSGRSRNYNAESPKFMLNIGRDSARSLKVEDVDQRKETAEECSFRKNNSQPKTERIPPIVLDSPQTALDSPSADSIISTRRTFRDEGQTNRSKSQNSSQRSRRKTRRQRTNPESEERIVETNRHSPVESQGDKSQKTTRKSSAKSNDTEQTSATPNSATSRISKSPKIITPKTTESRFIGTPRSKKIPELNLTLDTSERPESRKASCRSVKTLDTVSDRTETKRTSHKPSDRSTSSRSKVAVSSPRVLKTTPRTNSGRSKDSLENQEESERARDTVSNHSAISSVSSWREVGMPSQQHSYRSEIFNPDMEMENASKRQPSRSRNSSKTSVDSNITEAENNSPKQSSVTSKDSAGVRSHRSFVPDEDEEEEEEGTAEESRTSHRSKIGDDSDRLSNKRLSVINEVSLEDLETSNVSNEENDCTGRDTASRTSPERTSVNESASTELGKPEREQWNELINTFKASPNRFFLEKFPGFPVETDNSWKTRESSGNKMAASECEENTEEHFFPTNKTHKITSEKSMEENLNTLVYEDPLSGKTKQEELSRPVQTSQNIYYVNVSKGGPFGIGEFGDVTCWNAGDSDTKDTDKPKDHGDGIPTRSPEVRLPEKGETDMKTSLREDFQDHAPLVNTLFLEVTDDADFTRSIPCRLKASKSDNCINKKISGGDECQTPADSVLNIGKHKSDANDLTFGEKTTANKFTVNRNSSSESLGSGKDWEILEFAYERTPRLSRSLSNLDVRLQREPSETLSLSGSDLFKREPEVSKPQTESANLHSFLARRAKEDKMANAKSGNWLKLRHAEGKNSPKHGRKFKTKSRKKSKEPFHDYLPSRKGRPGVPALKLRHPNCFQNFYKRFISVFCLTSSSSAATSK